jgi:hypothetical protein
MMDKTIARMQQALEQAGFAVFRVQRPADKYGIPLLERHPTLRVLEPDTGVAYQVQIEDAP